MAYLPQENTRITKTLTFLNDAAGALDLFTVTGDVEIELTAVCSTIVASAAAANVRVGVASDTDSIIVSTLATDIDADEIWNDATPTLPIEPTSARLDFTIHGEDVILTLDAQVDSGVIAFHVNWRALSVGATVVGA